MMAPPFAIAAWLAGSCSAEAADIEARIEVTGGTLAVGERGTASMVVLEDGRPLSGVLTRLDGRPVTALGPGRYTTEVTWYGSSWEFSGTLTTVDGERAVRAKLQRSPSGETLEWPVRIVGTAGSEDAVAVDLSWPGQGTIEDIWVATGAGRVESLRQEVDGLKVGVSVPPDPFPRAIPLLAIDASSPGSEPALGVLVLRARTQIPVRTTPGTVVTVEVGGRVLPSVTADESGVASVSVWVRPGETTARLRLADPAGNSNTSTIRLGGDPRPHLVGVATAGQPGERDPSVVIAATSPSGAPWSGLPPRCSSNRGSEVVLLPVKPGVWRGPLTEEDLLLGRIECHLGVAAQTVLRLPRPPVRPDKLMLRVSPSELDARSPEATIRAWVVDRRGDRLPVTPPVVEVDHGRLEVDDTEGADGLLTLRYDGLDAVGQGAETVRVRWASPAGSGPIRDLDLRWGQTADGSMRVYGRALDNLGQPIESAGIAFELDGASYDGVPWVHGWATASVPSLPEAAWVLVRGVQSGRSVGAWVLPGDQLALAPGESDLVVTRSLPVHTGPVRQVGLQVNPATLVTAEERTALVLLDLRDADGSAVTNLPVQIAASRGTLSEPRLRTDGRFEATYTPERPGDIGRVEVRAQSPGEQFPTTTTELELVSADLRRAPGLHVGWMSGTGGISSPWLSIDGEIPLEVLPDSVRLLLSAGVYGLRASSVDPVTGQDLAVSADLAPLGVGLTTRQARRRFVTRAGASMLVIPYWVRVSVDASQGLRGLALAPPGAHAHAGLGFRTRQGEVDLSMGYLFVTTRAGEGGWQGLAGGVLATVGYRHGF